MKEITEFLNVLNETARSPLGWLLVPILLALFCKTYLLKGWGTRLYTLSQTSITRHYDEKHQQIAVQVELEMQIKSLLSTNTELQTHLRSLLEDRSTLGQVLKDLTDQISLLAEGLWEDRRALASQLATCEKMWRLMGVQQPNGGNV
jgi:septal ring factor EnvC (AmiA/AmiB activator)